ncbi:MAG TPA: hypothetical protein VJT49_29835 [Amycolatopsis sp.]|uniref:hypothetical protein n=1 Tax=Amycolatopsis sp. TaxID=37632 RepID=UPI002B4642B6|nr:hypothetical protein [Amycolatopsis sp.]HKS49236.1 hypothetical protein [Amycolatopsis sp.]
MDGTRIEADVIVCATGYTMSFPFFDDPALLPDEQHRFPLFKRIVKPGIDNLYYVGLAQASPTIVNLAKQQSKLIARHLTGRDALPGVEEMNAAIARDEDKHQYYRAPRHTSQIDFARYVKDLHRCGQRERLHRFGHLLAARPRAARPAPVKGASRPPADWSSTPGHTGRQPLRNRLAEAGSVADSHRWI